MKMKNEDIILDSNVLIAFYNESDSLYEKALAVMKATSATNRVISDLVFAEIGTVLLIKTKQTSFVSKLLGNMLSGKVENIHVSIITKQLLTQTLEVFSNQKRQDLSFEDCSVISLARQAGIKRIATFDKVLRREFSTEFEFLPKNI